MDQSGVRATYDAIARAYDAELCDELRHKPLDRALLTALLELAGPGTVGDVGCGPGHVTALLAAAHPDVVGVDLSPEMVAVARERAPGLDFMVGSMLELPVEDAAWAGAVALYSVIHLDDDGRSRACAELARVVRPGGWVLVSFHVDSEEFATGEVSHLTTWFGHRVDIDGHFLDPADVTARLEAAGLAVTATMRRDSIPGAEHPSRRCYLLAQRRTS